MERIIILAVLSAMLAGCAMDGVYAPDFNYSEPSGDVMPEPPSGDDYADYADNPFISTEEQAVSTFSIDADGASYANVRRYIKSGMTPPPAAVRIEEFLNYFTFNYDDPADGNAIAINAEVGPCPWTPENRLIRLGIKGKSMKESELPDANFVFLIDVSGSMSSNDKLYLLKSGLITLLDYLRPDDRISIVTYSGSVKKLLESTPVRNADKIRKAISKLTAGGSTAGGEAMEMAYKEALENFIEGGNNRVIMGTDGDFNVGVTDTDELMEMVQKYAAKGVYLTICGFGRGNLNDSMMEKVSNNGNGTYEYIAFEEDMVKVFVNERSEFFSVANDTKIQVTFDPAKVDSYRLIGYENRILSNEDFENDDKDAGEIGAGQTITALYEIVPAAEGSADEGALAVFDVRYKKALGDTSIPLSLDVVPSDALNISPELNFAASLAAYGMILRDSPYKGEADLEMVSSLARTALEFDPFGYRADFLEIVQETVSLDM